MKYQHLFEPIKIGKTTIKKGKIRITNADEVYFYITGDTDYKINFDPDFNNPRTYVGVNPDETTAEWIKKAVSKGYDKLFDKIWKI